MFILKSIEIHQGCTGQKNLKPGKYVFVQDEYSLLPENFFGQNICVSAIVGKNGSGKSSLIDIMCRVLNNLCAVLCTNLNDDNYTAFCYVYGVNASLEYVVYDKNRVRPYCIRCIENTILIDAVDIAGVTHRYSFGKKIDECRWYRHYTSLNDFQRTEISKELFYGIIVNYAPFALNSEEYSKETCVGVNDRLEPDKIDLKNHNWLQSIFHKNDGYQSCITFAPYRDSGKFDASKEARLSRERILEILCVHNDFIENYEYHGAHFRLNEDSFKNKFALTCPTRENGYKPKMEVKELIWEFDLLLEDWVKHGEETISSHILSELGYRRSVIVLDSRPHTVAYLYLVYKVLNCARYPSFSEYIELSNTDYVIDRGHKEFFDKAILLTKAINTDHSHITFKIDRTKNFLKAIGHLNWDIICSNGLELNDYLQFLNRGAKESNLIKLARNLPPSFFDFEILLKFKTDERLITFEQLSSGERQLYVTISSVIYHSMNLLSVAESRYRVKYSNVLAILDEVELCYHPDYQRRFINRLLSTIKRLNFNEHLNYHILLTSHSPFILSDIPHTNILYLENGHPSAESESFVNPFCANLNVILSQSFFLSKDGFIGEHAKHIVNSLYQFLANEPQRIKKKRNIQGQFQVNNRNLNVPKIQQTDIEVIWDKESAKDVIELIGEPLIQESLRQMYNERFRDADSIRRQIADLTAKLKDMEEGLKV